MSSYIQNNFMNGAGKLQRSVKLFDVSYCFIKDHAKSSEAPSEEPQPPSPPYIHNLLHFTELFNVKYNKKV